MRFYQVAISGAENRANAVSAAPLYTGGHPSRSLQFVFLDQMPLQTQPWRDLSQVCEMEPC